MQSVISFDDVRKTGYDFSTVSTIYSLVNNKSFAEGYSPDLSNTTSLSYVWQVLSSITDEVGNHIYENVLNYIDNIGNIDLCKVKALLSMVKMTSTNYVLFDNLTFLPDKIMNMIDILSIKKDILLNSKTISLLFSEKIKNQISLSANIDRNVLSYKTIIKISSNNIPSTDLFDSNKINGQYLLVKEENDNLIYSTDTFHGYQLLLQYTNEHGYSVVRLHIIETDFNVDNIIWAIANDNGLIFTIIDKSLYEEFAIGNEIILNCNGCSILKLDNPYDLILKFNSQFIPAEYSIKHIESTNDNDKLYREDYNLMLIFAGNINNQTCDKLYFLDNDLNLNELNGFDFITFPSNKNDYHFKLIHLVNGRFCLLYCYKNNGKFYSNVYIIDINDHTCKKINTIEAYYDNMISKTLLGNECILFYSSTNNNSSNYISEIKMYYNERWYNTKISSYNCTIKAYENTTKIDYFIFTASDLYNILIGCLPSNLISSNFSKINDSSLSISINDVKDNKFVDISMPKYDSALSSIIDRHMFFVPAISSNDSNACKLYGCMYSLNNEMSTVYSLSCIPVKDAFNIEKTPFGNKFNSIVFTKDCRFMFNDNYFSEMINIIGDSITEIKNVVNISPISDNGTHNLRTNVKTSTVYDVFIKSDDNSIAIYTYDRSNNIWRKLKDLSGTELIYTSKDKNFNLEYIIVVTDKNVYVVKDTNVILIFDQDMSSICYAYANVNYNYNDDIMYIFAINSRGYQEIYSIDYKLDIIKINNNFKDVFDYSTSLSNVLNYNLNLFMLYSTGLYKNSLADYPYCKLYHSNLNFTDVSEYNDIFTCININSKYYDSVQYFKNDNVFKADSKFEFPNQTIIKENYYLDSDFYSIVSSLYYDMLIALAYSTYNSELSTPIFVYEQDTLLNSYDEVPNSVYAIVKFKALNDISYKFNEIKIADAIEAGTDRLENYTAIELQLLQLVFDNRSTSKYIQNCELKYSYYQEKNLKEFLKFIEYEYNSISSKYLNAGIYDLDNTYLSTDNSAILILTQKIEEVQDNISEHKNPSWGCWIKDSIIKDVANILTDLTIKIKDTREKLKNLVLKNYMKGSFLFLSYVINEYLKNTYSDLISSDDNTLQIKMTEYIDQTEYFNISANSERNIDLSTDVNARYWEQTNRLPIINLDDNNLFKTQYSLTYNFSIPEEDLIDFYKNNLKMMNTMNNSSYYNNFLSTLFDYAADCTFISSDNYTCLLSSGTWTDGSDLSPHISAEYNTKKSQFLKYSGLKSGKYPYINHKNQKHSSYLIHPYLKHFIEYVDMVYPIKNIYGTINNNWSEIIASETSVYFGQYGNLIDMWKNPMKYNENYLSRYESSTHIDKLGIENALINYDGAFYPPAYNDYLNNYINFIRGVKNNTNEWYKHLQLNQTERDVIYNQLTSFHDIIKDSVKKYNIVKYVKDIYDNAYILYNDGVNKKSQLWIRLSQHPIAFPAYCYNKKILQVNMNDAQANKKITLLEGYDEYIPNMFYDMFMSDNKTTLLLNGNIKDQTSYGYVAPVEGYPELNSVFMIMNAYQYISDKTYDNVFTLRKDTINNFDFIYHPTNSELTWLYKGIFSVNGVPTLFYILNDNSDSTITILEQIFTDNKYSIKSLTTYNVKYNSNLNKHNIILDYNESLLILAYTVSNRYEDSYSYMSKFGELKPINYISETIDLNSSFNAFNQNIVLITFELDITSSFVLTSQRLYNIHADIGMIPVYQLGIVNKLKLTLASNSSNVFLCQLLGKPYSSKDSRNTNILTKLDINVNRVFEEYDISDSYDLKHNLTSDIYGNKLIFDYSDVLDLTSCNFFVFNNNSFLKNTKDYILSGLILYDKNAENYQITNICNNYNIHNGLPIIPTTNYIIDSFGYSNNNYTTNSLPNISSITLCSDIINKHISIDIRTNNNKSLADTLKENALEIVLVKTSNAAFDNYHLMSEDSNVTYSDIKAINLSGTYALSNTILSSYTLPFKINEIVNSKYDSNSYPISPVPYDTAISDNLQEESKYFAIEVNELSTIVNNYTGLNWLRLSSSFSETIQKTKINRILFNYTSNGSDISVIAYGNLENNYFKKQPAGIYLNKIIKPGETRTVYGYIELYNSLNELCFNGYATLFLVKNISDGTPKIAINNVLLNDLTETKYYAPLQFTKVSGNPTIKIIKNGIYQDTLNASLQFLSGSDDPSKFESYTIGTSIPLSSGYNNTIYFKAAPESKTLSKNLSAYYQFEITGGTVSANGNILWLLDNNGETLQTLPYCYYNLFSNCSSLINTPYITIETTSKGCCLNMFKNCTELTSIEKISFNSASEYCCASMFEGCNKITNAENIIFKSNAALANNCYESMFNGCTSLTQAPALPATTLADSCYASMFRNCTSLTQAPELLAKVFARNCCIYMFSGCTSLIQAPSLQATILADHCCYNMFSDCTSLTQAPALPAITLANNCYESMFNGCTSLTQAPVLPATTLAYGCYASMFQGCLSLTQTLTLSTEILADSCYVYMFSDCSSLTQAPALPATTLADSCYASMFRNCTSLTQAPELLATTLNSYCYASMFRNCISLSSAPVLSATTLAKYCCYDMFTNCCSLSSAPALPATSLADLCYLGMFYNCTSLTQAPVLNAETLNTLCYTNMFYGCSSLTSSPALPATTLADSCYAYMFSDCTSLTQAPALQATTLADNCCFYMFSSCTSLSSAPALPATILADYCYSNMFYNCTSLTQAPALPATTLAYHCYASMFKYCISLTSAPELPATILTLSCYADMFNNCRNLKLMNVNFTDWNNGNYTTNWVQNVAANGKFIKPEELSIINGPSYIPNGWIMPVNLSGVTFSYPTGGTFNIQITLNYATSKPNVVSALDYIVKNDAGDQIGNLSKYYLRDTTATITVPAGYNLILSRNDKNTEPFSNGGAYIAYITFNLYSRHNDVDVYGDLNKLINISAEDTLPKYCWYNAFNGCTSLRTAPSFNAKEIEEGGCENMFYGCTSLNSVQSLPATTIGLNSYESMFYGCTSLQTAPSIKATTLNTLCCMNMFRNCTSLRTASELPATTLAKACYAFMFYGCTSLQTAPSIKATTLNSKKNCCISMFEGCTNLTTPPELPATELTENCYLTMFKNCTALTKTPDLSKVKTIGKHSCESMFENCNKLTEITNIDANTISECGCLYTYVSCNSLVSLNSYKIEAQTFDLSSCYGMFCECQKLEHAPEKVGKDENTSMGAYSCYGMFYKCQKLMNTPLLPATTLGNSCYMMMFHSCTSMQSINNLILPATNGPARCYRGMFMNCENLTDGPIIYLTSTATAKAAYSNGSSSEDQQSCYEMFYNTNVMSITLHASNFLPGAGWDKFLGGYKLYSSGNDGRLLSAMASPAKLARTSRGTITCNQQNILIHDSETWRFITIPYYSNLKWTINNRGTLTTSKTTYYE